MKKRATKKPKVAEPSKCWDNFCSICHKWCGHDDVAPRDGVCSYCLGLIDRGRSYEANAIIELAGRMDGYDADDREHADHLVRALCLCRSDGG